MTNREYIIAQLSNKYFIVDDGVSYESVVGDMIACPYYSGDKRALCNDVSIDKVDRDMRFRCKEKWLNSEVSE